MCGGELDPRDPDEAARTIPVALITDSKNLFDKLHRPTVCIKGAKKRSDIEAVALRLQLERTDTPIHWVHGGAMISNSLTKVLEKYQMFQYLQLGFRFKIVFDENYVSEKQR